MSKTVDSESTNAVADAPENPAEANDHALLEDAAFHRLLGLLESMQIPVEAIQSVQDELDRIRFLGEIKSRLQGQQRGKPNDRVHNVCLLDEIDWVLETLAPHIRETGVVVDVDFTPGIAIRATVQGQSLRHRLFQQLNNRLHNAISPSEQLMISIGIEKGKATVRCNSDLVELPGARETMRQPRFNHLSALVIAASPDRKETLRKRLQHAGVHCTEQLDESVDVCVTDDANNSVFRAIAQQLQHRPVVITGGSMITANPLWYSIDEPLTQVRLESVLDQIAGAQQSATGDRVLLVDDNPTNTRLLETQLIELGFAVDIAPGGEAALKLAAKQPYRLVFTDLHMPGMTGQETTRELLDRYPHMTVFGLTADISPGERNTCLDAGMIDVLQKPVRLEKLKRIVKLPGAMPVRVQNDQEPVYDISLALANADNRIGMAREMLDLLTESLQEDIEQLNDAAGDRERLRQLTHALHGALRFCGAPRLLQSVQRLESVLRSGDTEFVAGLLQLITSEATTLLSWHRENPDPFGSASQHMKGTSERT